MCTMLLWTNQRGELLWHCTEVTKPMNLINITSFIQNNLLSWKVAGLEEENVSIILYKLSLLSCLITYKRSYIYGKVVAVVSQSFEHRNYTWVKLEQIELEEDFFEVSGRNYIVMQKSQTISSEWLPYNDRGYKVDSLNSILR